MTLLEQLQTHKGGLLRLKNQLYWYNGRGYDNNPGRICLILDAAIVASAKNAAATSVAKWTRPPGVSALLLVDGSPHWVWVAEEDIERL